MPNLVEETLQRERANLSRELIELRASLFADFERINKLIHHRFEETVKWLLLLWATSLACQVLLLIVFHPKR